MNNVRSMLLAGLCFGIAPAMAGAAAADEVTPAALAQGQEVMLEAANLAACTMGNSSVAARDVTKGQKKTAEKKSWVNQNWFTVAVPADMCGFVDLGLSNFFAAK